MERMSTFELSDEHKQLSELLVKEMSTRTQHDVAPRQLLITDRLAQKLAGSRFLPPEGTITLLLGDPSLVTELENALSSADSSELKRLARVIDALPLSGPPTSRDPSAQSDVGAAFRDLLSAPSLFELRTGKTLLASYLAFSPAKLLAKAFPFASDTPLALDLSLRERSAPGRRVPASSLVIIRPLQLTPVERAANALLPAEAKIAPDSSVDMLPTTAAIATQFLRMAVVATIALYTGYNTAAKPDSGAGDVERLDAPPDREMSVAELLDWRRRAAPKLFG